MASLKDGALYYKKHGAYFVGGECPGCSKVFNIAVARPEHYLDFTISEGVRFSVLMCPDCATVVFNEEGITRVRDWCVANTETLREMNTGDDRDIVPGSS